MKTKTTVYIAMGRNPYSPHEFLGVYSHRRGAEIAIDILKDSLKDIDSRPFEFYDIIEKEIDSPIPY